MGVNWDRVKEVTLWTYEELLEKLTETIGYDFVSQFYDMKIRQVKDLLKGLLSREDAKYDKYLKDVLDTFRKAEVFGVGTLSGLFQSIPNREQCEYFIQVSNIQFEELLQLLNCTLRWILPFARPIREFIDKDDSEQLEHLTEIRKLGVRYNLDMIEEFRFKDKREEILSEGIASQDFVESLLHRCDISRLPYVSGNTVSILYHSGFDTLEKIASSSLEYLERSVSRYMERIGKKYSRSFIELESAINQASVLPKVIEL